MQIIQNNFKNILALITVMVLFNSCEKEYESIESIDDAKIKAYIQKNNIPAVKDPSGFYYQILEPGTGGPLLNKDSVFYTSVVKSLTGTTYYSPKEFSNEGTYLGYVTPVAYRTAMYTINRGGKVRVIVPSYLAFGKNGSGVVPANEVVVSDISVFLESKQWQLDERIILNFIAAKGLTGFTKHPSRVYQNITTVGTGDKITPLSTITVKYKGRLLNGTVFDESGTTDLVNALSDLIPGWRKVLVGVGKGTKMRILIPSDLAYGLRTDQPTIPSNSVLDFDIEIVDVSN